MIAEVTKLAYILIFIDRFRKGRLFRDHLVNANR